MAGSFTLRQVSLIVIGGLIIAAAAGFHSPAPAAAARTLTIHAGDGEPGYAVNEFLPNNVRINPGDVVHWETQWLEPHTVTFGQAAGDPTVPTHQPGTIIDYDGSGFISSGFVNGPSTDILSVRFSTEGEFPYYCALHPNMTGIVEVVDTDDVTSQATADEVGAAEYNSAILALKLEAANLAAVPTPVDSIATGTRYGVRAGGESFDGDIMQFFQPALSIKAGDSVRWTNPNGAPHNIVFGPPQQGDPFAFAGSDVSAGWDGTGGIQSPMLGQLFGGITEWTVRFSKPGTYEYICLLHGNQGMTGSITVQQAPTPVPTTAAPGTTPTATSPAATPKPPQTGTGASGSAGGGPTAALLLAGGLLAAGSLLVSLSRTRRSRRR